MCKCNNKNNIKSDEKLIGTIKNLRIDLKLIKAFEAN